MNEVWIVRYEGKYPNSGHWIKAVCEDWRIAVKQVPDSFRFIGPPAEDETRTFLKDGDKYIVEPREVISSNSN